MYPPNKKETIGIVGGMGPMAGILLQKLIVDFTPANTDQEHIPVITFTNTLIPDRTKSLLGPSQGRDFILAIQKTANTLAQAGATVIGIPCNTSHVKYSEIQKEVPIPIINMIKETISILEKKNAKKVGLLATDGTINGAVYDKNSHDIEWVIPNESDQKSVMQIIYEIKAGLPVNEKAILNACENFVSRGVSHIVLGCTEISMLHETISSHFSTVDPLRVLARSLINYVLVPNRAPLFPLYSEKTYHANVRKKTVKTH